MKFQIWSYSSVNICYGTYDCYLTCVLFVCDAALSFKDLPIFLSLRLRAKFETLKIWDLRIFIHATLFAIKQKLFILYFLIVDILFIPSGNSLSMA